MDQEIAILYSGFEQGPLLGTEELVRRTLTVARKAFWDQGFGALELETLVNLANFVAVRRVCVKHERPSERFHSGDYNNEPIWAGLEIRKAPSDYGKALARICADVGLAQLLDVQRVSGSVCGHI